MGPGVPTLSTPSPAACPAAAATPSQARPWDLGVSGWGGAVPPPGHGRGQLLSQMKQGLGGGTGASRRGRHAPQRKRVLSFFLEAVPVTHGHGSPAAHP